MQQVQDVEWWMDFPSREARPVVFALRIHFDSLGCRKLIWIRFGILIDYVRKASELRESSRSMEFAAPHTGTLRERELRRGRCWESWITMRTQWELSENSQRNRWNGWIGCNRGSQSVHRISDYRLNALSSQPNDPTVNRRWSWNDRKRLVMQILLNL